MAVPSNRPPSLTVLLGPQAGREITLLRAENTLGSAADCDVPLMAPGVAAIHARICLGPAGARLKREADAPALFRNDDPVVLESALASGDVVWLGRPGEAGSVMLQARLPTDLVGFAAEPSEEEPLLIAEPDESDDPALVLEDEPPLLDAMAATLGDDDALVAMSVDEAETTLPVVLARPTLTRPAAALPHMESAPTVRVHRQPAAPPRPQPQAPGPAAVRAAAAAANEEATRLTLPRPSFASASPPPPAVAPTPRPTAAVAPAQRSSAAATPARPSAPPRPSPRPASSASPLVPLQPRPQPPQPPQRPTSARPTPAPSPPEAPTPTIGRSNTAVFAGIGVAFLALLGVGLWLGGRDADPTQAPTLPSAPATVASAPPPPPRTEPRPAIPSIAGDAASSPAATAVAAAKRPLPASARTPQTPLAKASPPSTPDPGAARAQHVAALLEEGGAAQGAGQLDQALAAYQEALRLDPGNARASNAVQQVESAKADANKRLVGGRSFFLAKPSGKAPPGFNTQDLNVANPDYSAQFAFESTPVSPRSGVAWKVLAFVVNDGKKTIKLDDLRAFVTQNGTRGHLAVALKAKEIGPGKRVLVTELSGLWGEAVRNWSLDLVATTSRAETLKGSLAWK